MLNIESFQASTRKQSWYQPGLRILCACSGGPDSTALLHLLKTLPELDLAVVHLNHQLRGSESDADQSFVVGLAEELGLQAHIITADVGASAEEYALSLEEAGSLHRRHGFQQIIEDEGYAFVATGQHQDDQAETVLLNLYLGCGLKGLTGMAPHHDCYIRPLLEFSRAELMEYLTERGLPFRHDSSNLEARFLRNRIRHQLLPRLRSRPTAGVEDSLVDLSASAAALERLIRESIEHIDNKGIMCSSSTKISLGLSGLPDYFSPIKKLIFDSAFHSMTQASQGLSTVHYKQLLDLLPDTAIARSCQLPLGIAATRDRRAITLAKSYYLDWEPVANLMDMPTVLAFFTLDSTRASFNQEKRNPHYFWPQQRLRDYQLRAVREADKIQLGKGDIRPVLQVLQEAHIAPSVKAYFPVLVLGEAVVWVLGVRTAESAYIDNCDAETDECKDCLRVEFDEGIFE